MMAILSTWNEHMPIVIIINSFKKCIVCHYKSGGQVTAILSAWNEQEQIFGGSMPAPSYTGAKLARSASGGGAKTEVKDELAKLKAQIALLMAENERLRAAT